MRSPAGQRVLWCSPMGYVCHAIVTVLKKNPAENSCACVQTTECWWVCVVMVENIAGQLTATSYLYLPIPRNWNCAKVCSGQLGIQKTMPTSHILSCSFLSCIHAIFLKQLIWLVLLHHILGCGIRVIKIVFLKTLEFQNSKLDWNSHNNFM